MRPFKELNINDGGKPVSTPPPTVRDFQAIEDKIGFFLPTAYKNLLSHSNGGHPELDTFLKEGEWAINNFFHLGDFSPYLESVEWNYENKGNSPKSFLPFGRDGGGNLFCIDLSILNNPVYILIQNINSSKIIKLTESFEEFIDALSVNPDYI